MSTQITAGAWRRDKRFSPTLGGRWDFDHARLQTCIMGKDKYQSYYKELESFYFKHETREKKSFHEYNVCTMFMLEKQQDYFPIISNPLIYQTVFRIGHYIIHTRLTMCKSALTTHIKLFKLTNGLWLTLNLWALWKYSICCKIDAT